MADPLMEALRRKYPKKGPNPIRDKDRWAQEYMADISHKIALVSKLDKQKVPIAEICKVTGLYERSVVSLLTKKKRDGIDQ